MGISITKPVSTEEKIPTQNPYWPHRGTEADVIAKAPEYPIPIPSVGGLFEPVSPIPLPTIQTGTSQPQGEIGIIDLGSSA
jgi:hypothetical protein